MQETRQNRISRLLQKELASIFQTQTRMMHGVLVSVTRVKVSPDLSICTAYLSIFPSEKGDEMLKNINANEKTIRYDLGQRVHNQLRINNSSTPNIQHPSPTFYFFSNSSIRSK